MLTWSPAPEAGTTVSFLNETLSLKESENLGRKWETQWCSLLVVLDTEVLDTQALGPWQAGHLSSCSRAEGLEMPGGPRAPLMLSLMHSTDAMDDCLQAFSFFPTVQPSHMVWLWQISTEQWSQPARSGVFSHLIPTMSHRLWGLHLAGLVLKKGGNEITPKKDSLLWKGGDGGKNQIILRKNKSSGLGKTPQGDNTKESQQKLPNTLALSGPALLSEL